MYNQAFDLYHSIYRMIHILNNFEVDQSIEIDRLRIWDYFILFPNKVHKIRLGNNFHEIKKARKVITNKDNPYNTVDDGRKFLERLRPYQMGAISYLSSIGMIEVENHNAHLVKIKNLDKISLVIEKIGRLSQDEEKTLHFLNQYFKSFELNGPNGLKDRTGLLIFKYDGQ